MSGFKIQSISPPPAPGQPHQHHHDTQHQARAVCNSAFTGWSFHLNLLKRTTLIYVCYLRSSFSSGDLEAVSIINSSQKQTK